VSLAEDEDVPAIATTAPSAVEKRDLLGNVCFYLHFVVMVYILSGWIVPFAPALLFYAAFMPLVAIQWQFNKNSCVLNNIESLLRYGTWRAEQNAEEGAWLLTLVKNATGVALKAWQMDAITYGVMFVLWGAAVLHLLWW
jgi:hypothetical protein